MSASDDPSDGRRDAAAAYTADEQRVLREAVAAGGAAVCPRDGATMTRRPVGGGSFGLGYSRRREWLICPTCRRSALFDVKRGTRN
ncbi:MAG TPA: hypothetical protein VGD56_11490 [Gemmatirosa sp.]